MPTIDNIPPRYQKGINSILNFDENSFNELESILQSITDAYTETELKNQINQQKKNLSASDIDNIILSLKSLNLLVKDDDYPVDKLVDDISTIINKGEASEIDYKEQSLDLFKERLVKLLKIKSLSYTSKASDLITSNQHTFLEARVITDIRPIFSNDEIETPKVAIIVHNLKLHYEDNKCSEHKDLYITLDNRDLSELKKALERAEEKEKNIIKMLNDFKIKTINIQ